MKITMQHIAQKLGVSRTTVSLVIKGEADRYRIHPATAQKIRAYVASLNYKPDYLATALTGGKTRTIGVVFPNVFETFMGEVVKGIEDVLYPEKFTMMLCTSRFDRTQEVRNIEELLHRGVDGIIMIFNAPYVGEKYDYSHLQSLAKSPTPVVFVDRYLPTFKHNSVVADDRWAARQATNYLVRQRCGTIGFISLDLEISSLNNRYAGYRDTFAENGISHKKSVELRLKRATSQNDLESGLHRLFASKTKPDGILVTTHGLALKTIALLRSMGLSVPGDVRVAKFGADPDFLPSGALCIQQPHVQMGTAAARLVLDKIGSPQSPAAKAPIIIKPYL